jgi:hypothetical protein
MTAVWFLRRWWRHLCGDGLPHLQRQEVDDMRPNNGWDW